MMNSRNWINVPTRPPSWQTFDNCLGIRWNSGWASSRLWDPLTDFQIFTCLDATWRQAMGHFRHFPGLDPDPEGTCGPSGLSDSCAVVGAVAELLSHQSRKGFFQTLMVVWASVCLIYQAKPWRSVVLWHILYMYDFVWFFQIQIPLSQKLTHHQIRSENTAQGVIAKSSLFFFQTPCKAACVSINIILPSKGDVKKFYIHLEMQELRLRQMET